MVTETETRDSGPPIPIGGDRIQAASEQPRAEPRGASVLDIAPDAGAQSGHTMRRRLKVLHFASGHWAASDQLAKAMADRASDLTSFDVLDANVFSAIGDAAGWENSLSEIRTAPPEFTIISPPTLTCSNSVR